MEVVSKNKKRDVGQRQFRGYQGTMMLRRRSDNSSSAEDGIAASVEASEAAEAGSRYVPGLGESQESQESKFSRSGFSDTFFEALNFSDGSQPTDETVAVSGPPASASSARVRGIGSIALPENSELAQSIGVVCTLSRPSTNKRQKDIKPFALQKTFYAFPKIITEEQKEKIKARIEKDVVDFKFQKYKVEIHRFGLPFVVDEICCVSEGYNLTPKILKAALPPASDKKRKKRARKNESEDEESDPIIDDDEPIAHASKKIATKPASSAAASATSPTSAAPDNMDVAIVAKSLRKRKN
jgi:hypothetical protein